MKTIAITHWQVELNEEETRGQLVALDANGNKYTFYASALGNLDVIQTAPDQPTPRPVRFPEDFALPKQAK